MAIHSGVLNILEDGVDRLMKVKSEPWEEGSTVPIKQEFGEPDMDNNKCENDPVKDHDEPMEDPFKLTFENYKKEVKDIEYDTKNNFIFIDQAIQEVTKEKDSTCPTDPSRDPLALSLKETQVLFTVKEEQQKQGKPFIISAKIFSANAATALVPNLSCRDRRGRKRKTIKSKHLQRQQSPPTEYSCSSNTVSIENTIESSPTSNRRFKCGMCAKAFNRRSHLNSHMTMHTGSRPHHCTQCDKSFAQSSNLKAHIAMHAGERGYKCDVCQKAFTQSSNLKSHMTVHTGENRYCCPQCKRAFSRSGQLRSHLLTHNTERNFSCHLCCKAFARSCYLTKHMTTHTGQGNFICEICQKAFAYSTNLKAHLATHSRERPFKCHLCEKSFTTSGGRKAHTSTHGEGLFNCQLCKRAFAFNSTLKTHMITVHNKGAGFSCNYCDNVLNQKHGLKLHYACHHGRDMRRTFNCDMCNKEFTRKGTLKMHIRSFHNGERRFECEICKKSFCQIGAVRRHFNITHGKEQCEK